MDICIRPYSEADFDVVTSIWLKSWQSTGVAAPVTLDELRQRWPQELAKGWAVHVAAIGPDVTGFIALHGNELEQLFIAPEHQGNGIGKQMLDFAKAQRPGGLHLTTALQSRAGRFYEREGLTRGATGVNRRFGHAIVHYDWRP
ncbi:MAG TPA: GNAT family N-acetyltransferase [Rhizomicrobium sp.]|nr:GNAT family N-acetyltransferase [Rhizomicrobium sp.]